MTGRAFRSRKEIDRAGLLDRTGDPAMKLGGHSGDAAWKNLARFSRELREKIRIGVDDFRSWNVMPATRHLPVGLAEVDAALDCFWLRHENLAKFAVKGAFLKEVIKFHFFKTAWSAQALFVARGDVTGRRNT